jgi:ComF family protein
MSILDRIVSLYAPFACLGCELETDSVLCAACTENVARVPSRCYRCQATTRGYEVCAGCRRKTPLRRVAVWAHYEGQAKELIHRAKYERARVGLLEAADCMRTHIPQFGPDVLLVPVPTATGRARQRGYDQALVIARHLSRHSGLPTARLLARLGQAHQVGAGRAERVAHLQNAFRALQSEKIRGAHIVLIDDVCTTGATLESAARTLRAAGAKRVDALVFAQPN